VGDAVYLFLDCETTGLPKRWGAPITDLENWPRIVQIAWLLYDETDRHVESMSCLVQPDGFTIPRDAQRIHGITTERALTEGRPLLTVLAELDAAADRSSIVVSHNLEFDRGVISAEYLRLGLDPLFRDKTLICTMVSSTEYCRLPGPYGYKWPTLPELHRALFGGTYVEAHDAGTDVAGCARCFFELKRRRLVAV
jgi:DNA polymerase III epsilon subunit-like protein